MVRILGFFPFRRLQSLYTEAFQNLRGNGRALSTAAYCRLRRFDGVSISELLSVAVFAGLSGRTDLLGLFMVYLLAPLSHSLDCPASGFAQGKTS
jgi:hypothetical protein